MKFLTQSILSLAILVLCFTSCKKDDPIIPDEEEVITTLTYTLTPVGGGADIEFSFTDVDGDGGDDPVYTSGILAQGVTYTATMELRNEQAFPGEDVTEEIEEESLEHQFFFQTDFDGLTINYADQDSDGNPIGLSTTITAASAGSGTFTIILRHEPNKTAEGVSDGNIANAGGETDIEVTFNIGAF